MPVDSIRAVFLSYASQDAEAVEQISDALRAIGIEVWFDKNELAGGDAWDRKIRAQIRDCALFVPVISANTNARAEGYFRLEWKLAVDRSHLMADDEPFLLPVVIDAITDAGARVPDKFREVQWTRLSANVSHAAFAARVEAILSPAKEFKEETKDLRGKCLPPARRSASWWRRYAWALLGLAFCGALALRFVPQSERINAAKSLAASEAPAAATPRFSEARQLAERAFTMSVDSFDSTLDDFVTAEGLMKRALSLDSTDGEILARSAQLQLMFRNRGFDASAERIATGREQAERAIRLVPDSPEALMALALAQRYTGNMAAHIKTLRRLVALAPDHARALLMLSTSLASEGTALEEVLALNRRASQQPKWAPLAHFLEFGRLWERGEFGPAEAAARKSYAAQPSANNAGAIALLHLTWKGDLDEAARELSQVPPSLLNAPRVVVLTAHVHLSRRAPDEALRALDRLADDFIRDSVYTGPKAILTGRAHALAGRRNAARLAWEAGLRVIDARLKAEPGERSYRRARGELLAWLGRTDEALEEAGTMEEISGGQALPWNLSSVPIYAALGRADLAVPRLEKLLAGKGTRGWHLTVTLLKQDPLWDKLRGHPGFDALLAGTPGGTVAAPAKTEEE